MRVSRGASRRCPSNFSAYLAHTMLTIATRDFVTSCMRPVSACLTLSAALDALLLTAANRFELERERYCWTSVNDESARRRS